MSISSQHPNISFRFCFHTGWPAAGMFLLRTVIISEPQKGIRKHNCKAVDHAINSGLDRLSVILLIHGTSKLKGSLAFDVLES